MAFPSFNLKNTRPKSITGREGMLREVWRTKQGGREAYCLALDLLTVCVNRLVQFHERSEPSVLSSNFRCQLISQL